MANCFSLQFAGVLGKSLKSAGLFFLLSFEKLFSVFLSVFDVQKNIFC